MGGHLTKCKICGKTEAGIQIGGQNPGFSRSKWSWRKVLIVLRRIRASVVKRLDKFPQFASNQLLTTSFFFTHVLIPLGLLSIYLVAFSWLLPEGVNKAFVTRSGMFVIPTTIFLSVIYAATQGRRGDKRELLESAERGLSAGDLTLILLPLAPIVQYVASNLEILSPIEAVAVFGFFALFAALFILALPYLVRNSRASRPVMSLGLAFAFLITNMAFLSRQSAWHGTGALGVQWAIFGVVLLFSYLLFHFSQEAILYLMITAFFLTHLFIQLSERNDRLDIRNQEGSDNRLITLIATRKPVVTPSIYLLVYDSYVANETMLAHGIDNQAQERYLTDLGFKLYPNTYSVGSHSVSTMSRTLNVSASYYGKPRKAVSGDGVVQNLLAGFGYQTYGVFPSDFYFRGIAPSYDHSFPATLSSSDVLLIKAILAGEFRFDFEYDDISRAEYLEEKREIFSDISRYPRFLYSHSDLPGHSQNSGVCLANEVELFGERLVRANEEMRQDVEIIIENDPDAVLIIAGDHGPYLTKNCTGTDDAFDLSQISRLDIQDRFGTFLAIRWPTEGYAAYDDITVIQDLFPAVFAYMFQDPGLLATKIDSTSREEQRVSGAYVVDGVIHGGMDDGEPLFVE